eukprot:6478258-Amphidinium_carterae.1
MGRGKGKGQKKGAPQQPEISEIPLEEQVRRAIPGGVQQALQPQLTDTFNVPCKLAHQLDGTPGVAFVPKVLLPEVIRRVGTTYHPVAFVSTQPCWELGMLGYTSTPIWVTVRSAGPGGFQDRYSQKYITQLSLGQKP